MSKKTWRWPTNMPDQDDNDALKSAEQSGQSEQKPFVWEDPGDWTKVKKSEPEQRPSKEKVPPTWGRGFLEYGDLFGESDKSQPAPVDKQALKQQRDDAKWAAKQQRAIAKANERRANDAGKAAAWQAAADREIAKVNQGYQKGGAAESYDKPERGDTGESGDGCGCIFASLPGWFILLLLALLALDILING